MDSLSNVDLANIDLNDPEQTKDLSRETLNKLKHQQLHEQHKGQFSGNSGHPDASLGRVDKQSVVNGGIGASRFGKKGRFVPRLFNDNVKVIMPNVYVKRPFECYFLEATLNDVNLSLVTT